MNSEQLPTLFDDESNHQRRRRRQRRLLARKKNSRLFYGQQESPHHDRQYRKGVAIVFSLVLFVYLYTLFRTEELLENYRLQGGSGNNLDEEDGDNGGINSIENSNAVQSDNNNSYYSDRFIIFKKMAFGQGTGNIMSGLLAAHLLGEEFNRIVCVEKNYVEFHAAFELVDPHARALCANLLEENENGGGGEPDVSTLADYLQAISFSFEPNECDWQDRLSRVDTKVIRFEGNSYPRWPKVKEDKFFTKLYQPRPALLDILPYTSTTPPETVVHLRAPDGDLDMASRQGLDEESLMQLGKMLPSDTYLVTNRVEWYKLFEEKFHWSHPNWELVRHSISGIAWTSTGNNNKANNIVADAEQFHGPNDARRNLEMFADWYTIATAKTVYHTHSEFSNSAVHWMNIDSKVINGIDRRTNQLTFRTEAWINDGLSPALLDRTTNPEAPREMQLNACGIHHNPVTQDDLMRNDIPRPVPLTGIKVGGKARALPAATPIA